MPRPSKDTPKTRGQHSPGSRKRKRREVDFHSAVNPNDEDAAINPAKRHDTKLAIEGDIKVGPKSGHVNTAGTGATISSKPTVDTSLPTPTNDTSSGEDLKGTRPTVTEVTDSQSSQQAVSSQVPATRQQPTPFEVYEQAQNFERFYYTIESATRKVVTSIGDLDVALSSLHPSPLDSLEALYTRFWGSEWKVVCRKLYKTHVFTVPEVVMSLISAFLYDNVLNQHASVPEIQAKQLELKGTTGRAILRMLDLENEGQRLAEVVRTIESEDAIVRLAQNEEQLQQQLRTKAEMYARELWSIIVPHFRSLSTLAQGYGLSSDNSEQDWLEVFMPAFTQLIESILRYRLELLATGCKHVYTFPDADAAYDLKEMGIHGGRMKIPLQVMFTVFPGVSVVLPKKSKMEALPGTKAMVKVRVVKSG